MKLEMISELNSLQLKEMVLALLRESELTLPDDVVEAIVNKVVKNTVRCINFRVV